MIVLNIIWFVPVAVNKISFVDLELKQLENDGVEYCIIRTGRS